MKVIPIRDAFRTRQSLIVERAFFYWRERLGLGYGSPEQDLLRAHEDFSRVPAGPNCNPTNSGLFVVKAPGKRVLPS